MPSIKILNSNTNTTTTDSASFSTSISTSTLPSKETTTHSLTRRTTLTHLSRWVSRKMSRQKLGPHQNPEEVSPEQELEYSDAYAAYLRAFSEGRAGPGPGPSPGTEVGEEVEGEGEARGGYPGHGNGNEDLDRNVFAGFDAASPSVPNGDYFSGPQAGKGEKEEGNGNRDGKYSFLRHVRSRQSVRDRRRLGSSDDVPADQLLDFRPIGFYGFSPLAEGEEPVSPPPGVRTPAMVAQENRVEREKSQEQNRQQKSGRSSQKGFWAPLRALWLHLRRAQ